MKKTAVIAIVGRPNVGKSTLFNAYLRRKAAITNNTPGVTRDRHTALVEYAPYRFLLIDTGGFEPYSKEYLPQKMRLQSEMAVEEADVIFFLTDRTAGWHPQDQEIFAYLRKQGKPVLLLVNKTDHHNHEQDLGEFYESGADQIFAVSAEHNRGLFAALEEAAVHCPSMLQSEQQQNEECCIAIVGRPNAGKSSLLNRFLNADRQIVDDRPGTTRDSVDSVLRFHNASVRMIDTAGIRQKSKVSQLIDRHSMVSSLKSIERSDVVILVLDSQESTAEQDARIASYAIEHGKSIVIAVNKWDRQEDKEASIAKKRQEILKRLYFLEHSPLLFVSAASGKNTVRLMEACLALDREQKKRIATADVNRVLASITARHEPPVKSGKRIKIYYGTQIGVAPPTFVLKTNSHKKIPHAYERFIVNQFRRFFGFDGVPISIRWDHDHKSLSVAQGRVQRRQDHNYEQEQEQETIRQAAG